MKLITATFFLLAISFYSSLLAQTEAEIYQKNSTSTVTISTDQGAQGSGFFVGTNLIVTNFHLIDGANSATCRVNNSPKEYEIEGYVSVEKNVDLILLKVKELNREAIAVASTAVQIDDKVYTIGTENGNNAIIKSGIVIDKKDYEGRKLIQITNELTTKSSGGPVLNSVGELIGVSALSEIDGNQLNITIPKHYLERLIELSSPVAEPLYSLVFKENSSNDLTITGNVCFYQNHVKNGRIDLFIDGVSVGPIDSYLTSKSYVPACGDNGQGIKSLNLPEGEYTYQARGENQLWNGKFEITEEGCEQILLEYIPREAQDCFSRIQSAFQERGSKALADGMHDDVVVSFFEDGESYCVVAKARVFKEKVINLFIQMEDGNFKQFEKKFYNSEKLKPNVTNGISEMIYSEEGEEFKVCFMDVLNDEKKAYMEARLSPSIDCPDYCFVCLSNKFKAYGAEPIPDGMDRNVIISFFVDDKSKCIEGKARVENGVITSIFMKYVDGTYEFVDRKFYNNKEEAPQIIDGITEMIYTENGEQFKIVFIDRLKSKENMQVWDPSSKL